MSKKHLIFDGEIFSDENVSVFSVTVVLTGITVAVSLVGLLFTCILF